MKVVPSTWRSVGSSVLLRRNISRVRESLPISVADLSLTFRWVGLKPIDYLAVEFFDKGVRFSWRAYRNLGTCYICVDSVMGPFVDTVETTIPLTGFEERRITYLVATNAGWLPYLVDEGIRFVHYLANRVKR